MKWLQSQSQRIVQILLQSTYLLSTPSSPLLLGSAAYIGFYTIFGSIQRPNSYRRHLFQQSERSTLNHKLHKINASKPSLNWQKYANIRFYCPKPHSLHWSDFKKDNMGKYFVPRQCDFCGSERFLQPSLRSDSIKIPLPSILKMTKDTIGRKILPRLLQNQSTISYHLQQFLDILPNAKVGQSLFHLVGLGQKLHSNTTANPPKTVRFSKAEYVFYNASI